MHAKNYDYIFLGAGCSSLSIIMRMVASKNFEQKKILVIDKEPKTKNDRTWCFWEREAGFFEDIVYRKWSKLSFKTDDVEISLGMGGYHYKMIRGIDFYHKCFSIIKACANIDVIYGEISIEEGHKSPTIEINGEPLDFDKSTILFNSLYTSPVKQRDKFYLLQHFKGWIVEAASGFFDAEQATLMDFRVSQEHGTSFVYVLPLSTTKALIEYTLFTENLLTGTEYNTTLKNYLEKFLGLENYSIVEEEFGVIPMTNADFPFLKNEMYFIGTAGGQTKASTGYTFRFIQKQADNIVGQLILKNKLLKNTKIQKRFLFYDSTLLHILHKKLLPGKTIFSILFSKNCADKVLKFLDNETTIIEEMKLLNSLPKVIFFKAGFIEFVKMMFPQKEKLIPHKKLNL